MKNFPLVLEIKGNSLDDGPGLRSVVFFKGCPLDCVWCHNPESKKRTAEISYDRSVCIGCGTCIDACAEGALSQKNKYFIEREKCTLCFSCVEVCPSGALSKAGSFLSVEEITDRIAKDKPFFDTSAGGVTLSGGEPTLDMIFTSELLKKLKHENIKTLIETCGMFRIDKFMELIYPYLDIIYYDIKIMDSEDHKKYCGVSNDQIISNFMHLNNEYKNGGVRILPRTPLVPDITDTEKNIRAIAEFYVSNGVEETELLSYNPLWHNKNAMIGIENPLTSDKKMTQWLSKEKENSCKRILHEAGIKCL